MKVFSIDFMPYYKWDLPQKYIIHKAEEKTGNYTLQLLYQDLTNQTVSEISHRIECEVEFFNKYRIVDNSKFL